MPLPAAVEELVARYKENRSQYLSGHYNETETRVDFVNPLFAALGWDMGNSGGLPEAYRQVVHEDAIKIGGTTKAPDYSFRVGGQRKFFLETKKPTVVLNLKPEPAYQLRRYAWTAKMPVSILTNFEEFVVYDGRVAPDHKDSPKTARLEYFKYTDYAQRWDELAARFSQAAVQDGAFDKYAEEAALFKASTPVDAAFLTQISGWREKLARDIAHNNPALSPRDLNFAVQMIIDRIIFLRICEDRGVETEHRLQPLLNGPRAYPRLLELFHQADDRYNSGLFHFQAERGRADFDAVTPGLTIDDRTLKEIIASVYYPESPFEFSVFPADILGQVYEQFLGQVIRIEGRTAVVEPKPEVKKAGGVYYTPTYIVDYIVKQTVGKLVEGKTPKQVASLRILDPACGSGSFLIGAYQFLIDWHRDWYVADGPAKWQRGKGATIYEGKGGVWRLTTAEKKRILLGNLYGVDIDTQAVEVTKLSLLLKVLEGESVETVNSNLKLFKERALPTLEQNIKCGNSLIGPDFYNDPKMADLDTETQLRINAFDWQTEFAAVMKGGGFDAAIGNPPYIRIQTLKEWAPQDVEFYKKTYISAGKGNYDIYVVFVERGLELLNQNGLLGFILPNKFFNAEYGQPLRGLIADGGHLRSLVHFGDNQVFKLATTYTTCLLLSKSKNEFTHIVRVKELTSWREGRDGVEELIPTTSLSGSEWNFAVGPGFELFTKLQNLPTKLGDIADIFVGLQTSADDVFIMDFVSEDENTITLKSKALEENWTFEKDYVFPVISGTDVKRYNSFKNRQYILFPYSVDGSSASLISLNDLSNDSPRMAKYLLKNQVRLEAREKDKLKGKIWHGYIYLKNMSRQCHVKLCVPRLVDRLYATYDAEGTHFLDNVDVGGITLKAGYIRHSLLYVLGLLNSKASCWYFPQVSAPFRGGYFSANRQFLSQLPIRTINFDDPAEKAQHDKMVSLVERMLTLNKELPGKTGQERAVTERQIAATDGQIDRLVYELYGLTAEEIKVVEGQAG